MTTRRTKKLKTQRTLGTRRLRLVAGVASLAMIGACGGGSGDVNKATTSSSGLPQGDQKMTLDPADFSTTIDNKFMPLVPGTQSTFREVDGEGIVTSIVGTVTNKTKRIANGITARVVRDTARQNGKIIEDTFDWFAQDKDGNVWYLGEDTATFKDGKKLSTEGSFEAGVDGAFAGVAMPAVPKPGQAYRQEYYKGQAEDNGEVLSTREMADVKYGHSTSVLLTKDTSTLETDGLEYKFYAPGVGLVLTIDIAGGSGREELLSVSQVPGGTATGPLGQPD